MLCREIIVVCSEIQTKHINTFCVQNVEFVNVKHLYVKKPLGFIRLIKVVIFLNRQALRKILVSNLRRDTFTFTFTPTFLSHPFQPIIRNAPLT
jgi:hypothetical protein